MTDNQKNPWTAAVASFLYPARVMCIMVNAV